MNEEEIQKQAEGLLGNWVWLLITGVAFLLFKSTLEGITEGLKVFLGKDIQTDDVVILDGRPARCIRVGIWKTTFFAYDIGTADGKPFVKGGTKIQIQNDKLKDHIIERPLQMLDLSKWEEKSDKK
jgi:hypothetical protein|tara:strand:+ start:64 stop:441 length:378 start_codon:yes stop_codon:yes gene_type:complete